MTLIWKPVNEDGHAIERAAITIIFDQGLNSKAFSRIRTQVAKSASEVGINEVLNFQQGVVQLQFGVPNQQPFPLPQPPQGLAGQLLRRTDNGRVREEVMCNPENLLFAVTAYEGWEKFLERVQLCLSVAVEMAANSVSLSELRLEYWDRFDGSPAAAEAASLVNPDSKLLSNFFVKQTGSWHHHIGFFRQRGDGRVLLNANLDVVHKAQGMPFPFPKSVDAQARIYTLVASQFPDPLVGFAGWADLKETAIENHALLKSIVGDIINPKLAERINLNARPFE